MATQHEIALDLPPLLRLGPSLLRSIASHLSRPQALALALASRHTLDAGESRTWETVKIAPCAATYVRMLGKASSP